MNTVPLSCDCSSAAACRWAVEVVPAACPVRMVDQGCESRLNVVSLCVSTVKSLKRKQIGQTMTSVKLTPFHVAVQVRDIAESRHFYGHILGCSEGRRDRTWVDFNFFGHQFVCHLNPGLGKDGVIAAHYNPVDGQGVPVPHFGVVLEMEIWNSLAERLRRSGVKFVIEPCIRFKGEVGEQATMFLLDPSGNALEFKSFRDLDRHLFAT
jgi:extradiol dioxygenase family protein